MVVEVATHVEVLRLLSAPGMLQAAASLPPLLTPLASRTDRGKHDDGAGGFGGVVGTSACKDPRVCRFGSIAAMKSGFTLRPVRREAIATKKKKKKVLATSANQAVLFFLAVRHPQEPGN